MPQKSPKFELYSRRGSRRPCRASRAFRVLATWHRGARMSADDTISQLRIIVFSCKRLDCSHVPDRCVLFRNPFLHAPASPCICSRFALLVGPVHGAGRDLSVPSEGSEDERTSHAHFAANNTQRIHEQKRCVYNSAMSTRRIGDRFKHKRQKTGCRAFQFQYSASTSGNEPTP